MIFVGIVFDGGSIINKVSRMQKIHYEHYDCLERERNEQRERSLIVLIVNGSILQLLEYSLYSYQS